MSNILITSSSSDIGLATINAIYSKYEKIVCHYHTKNYDIMHIKKELGDKIVLLQGDFQTIDGINAFINQLRETKLCINDVLHLSAPKCTNEKFYKIPLLTFQNEINISLYSIISILKLLLPNMVKNKKGKIVIMLSYVINNISPKYCSNYVIAKQALYGLVKALSQEVNDKGICVNGISPSWIDTKFIKNQPDIIKEKYISLSPIGRLLTVDDIVPTIVYLLSDCSNAITGQNITISYGS